MTTKTEDGPPRSRPSAAKGPRPQPGSAGRATRGARSQIDPRIRARRAAVQRDQGRRRLRRVLVAAALVALAASAYLLTRSPLLDVDHVRVHGAVVTDPAAAVAASGIERGTPMTDVATSGARDAIAALPRVDQVRVERRWPGTVEIHISEREPVAAVLARADGAGAGTWAVVDATGRVLETVDGPPDGLPVVTVDAGGAEPGSDQPGIAGALAVVRALTPDLRVWAEAVEPYDDGTVDLLLRDGIRVELGSQAHLTAKMIDLATVLTRVDLTDLRTIDLTVVHSPVVSRGPSAG